MKKNLNEAKHIEKTIINQCTNICRDNGYLYSGIKDGKACHCGNRVNPDRFYSERECNARCGKSGTSGYCGAFGARTSVYLTGNN